MSAPVAVEKELYATSFSGVVYKFNEDDGKILSATKSRATSAPVVVGNNVYLTRRTDDGKGTAKEAIAAPRLTRPAVRPEAKAPQSRLPVRMDKSS